MRVNVGKGKTRARIVERRADTGADHGKPIVRVVLSAECVRLLLDAGELQEHARGLVLLGVGQGEHGGDGLFKQAGHVAP